MPLPNLPFAYLPAGSLGRPNWKCDLWQPNSHELYHMREVLQPKQRQAGHRGELQPERLDIRYCEQ